MWPIEEDTTHPVLRNKTSESHTSTTNVQINFEIQKLEAAFDWGCGVGIKRKTASDGACGLSGDPSAVTKIFIVSCATDSYEMCFCGTVPQIVVHFDLSGSKCGTKTASF